MQQNFEATESRWGDERATE